MKEFKGCGKELNPVADVIIKCGDYVMSWDKVVYCEECEDKMRIID